MIKLKFQRKSVTIFVIKLLTIKIIKMKKFFSLFLLIAFFALNAQETANRFFYELTFKPKKDSARIDKVMTVLDITKDKSIYQDYSGVAQDSLTVATVQKMETSGTFTDITKMIKMPKFAYKVKKAYPKMKQTYIDKISKKTFGYEDELKFEWQTTTEKIKIGEYNTQKATTEYGGRKWTAWFAADVPFQDGPYRFYGLPGLIVKIEDEGKNYSWELKGNKKVPNYEEVSQSEKMLAKYGMNSDVNIITKEKFDKSMANYKADPLAEARSYMTPENMSRKMPGTEMTMGEFFKNQEKFALDFFNQNNNPIEIQKATIKAKK